MMEIVENEEKIESNQNASESDSSTSTSTSNRLGTCEVCNSSNAKYRCPKCEVKTCCLTCLNIHKKELNCDGIRDRTKFIPLKSMTKMDFMSDYNFLEECTRYVEDRKRDRLKRYTRYDKVLPHQMFTLRNAAHDRKIFLRFLLQNFSRRNLNTTYYDAKAKKIHWRIEWIFPNADNNPKYADDLCDESKTIGSYLNKYLDGTSDEDFPDKKRLEFYQSRGFSGVRVLLKSEGIKNARNRYYELDCDLSICENLKEKTLVEFPTILVIFSESSDGYDIIDPDEDLKQETQKHRDNLNEYNKRMRNIEKGLADGKMDDDLRKELENMQIAKKRRDRQKKLDEREKEPQNLLFTDESLWDELSDSDPGMDTEEEGGDDEVKGGKKLKTLN